MIWLALIKFAISKCELQLALDITSPFLAPVYNSMLSTSVFFLYRVSSQVSVIVKFPYFEMNIVLVNLIRRVVCMQIQRRILINPSLLRCQLHCQGVVEMFLFALKQVRKQYYWKSLNSKRLLQPKSLHFYCEKFL